MTLSSQNLARIRFFACKSIRVVSNQYVDLIRLTTAKYKYPSYSVKQKHYCARIPLQCALVPVIVRVHWYSFELQASMSHIKPLRYLTFLKIAKYKHPCSCVKQNYVLCKGPSATCTRNSNLGGTLRCQLLKEKTV